MQLYVMTDKSGGVKGKLPENQDVQNDKTVSSTKTKEGGLNENCTTVDLESSQSEPKKPPEKKVEQKPTIKLNGVNKNDTCKVKKTEDRKVSPTKPPKKSDTKTTSVVSSVSSSNKPYQPHNKVDRTSENKKSSLSDTGKSFTDDSRLSKLVRKIREPDRDRRLLGTKQLRDLLHTSEGARAAVKAADDLLSVLQDVLFDRPYKDLHQEVARCIGLVGSLLGQDGQRYLQMLFRQINNVVEDETRCCYLQALFETLKNDEKKQTMIELMPMVMTNVQTLLENANTSELLMSVVNIIIHISKNYPHVFSSHFCDTVDILVGWHIDATQKDDIIQFTSESLISFHQFWASDLPFSVTLLGQFLEDMEAYAEDLNLISSGQTVVDDEIAPPEDCIVKIGALLKVFTTVVKSLGDSFSSKSSHISKEYIQEVFERIIHSVENAIKAYYSEHVLIIVNQCLSLLVGLIPSSITESGDALFSFMVMQVFESKSVSQKYIATFTSLILKIIEIYALKLPVSFLSRFLAPGSLLQECRFSNSEEVISQVLAMYHAILGLKSVPLLEEAYRFVLGDMQQAYNTLLNKCGNKSAICVIPENPFAEVQYTITQAHTAFLFNLSALSEIANTKSNLIGMWALTPSVFNLLCEDMDPLQRDITVYYPAVQYAILYTLHSHCTRHGNFISSSTILTQNTILEGSVMSAVNPTTSSHFERVLKLLTQLLADNMTAYDAKCLCCKWISDIITSLHNSQHVLVMPEFVGIVRVLIEQGYNQEVHICICVCQCLQSILKLNTNFPLTVLKRCLKLCVSKVTDGRFQVRDSFFQLLKCLPINLFACVNNGLTVNDMTDHLPIVSENLFGLQNVWLAKRNHMGRIPLGTFHSHNFSQAMGFILHHISASQTVSYGWLEAMYRSSQRSNREDGRGEDLIQLSDVITGNESLLWFWTTWEAAQFCVLARLRTPLGKPQETFTSIEGQLKSYAAELRLSDEEVEPPKEKNTDSNSHLRVTLLLQFMEHLEKLLYNAYEGCAVAMPASPKTVRAFFRTNKKTCFEWLSRIRSSIISVALSCGKPAMAIRHSFELLKEMRENGHTQGTEFEQIVIWLVQALSDLQQPESLLGIYSWCKEVTGKKHSWIKAAAEKAYGRYETAAKEYKSAVRSMIGSDTYNKDRDSPEGSPRPSADNNLHRKFTGILSKQSQPQSDTNLPMQRLSFAVNEVVDCYMKLNDWESVLDWQETLTQYRQDKTLNCDQSAFSTVVDINYIKALLSFESGDMEYTKESLELVPGASLCDLGKTDSTLVNLWSPKQKLDFGHVQFLRVATAVRSAKFNNKNDLVRNLCQAEKLAEGVLRIASIDWPVLMSHDSMNILSIIATIRKQMDDKKNKTHLLPVSEEFSCGVDGQDVGCFLNAMNLLKLQYNMTVVDKKSDLMNNLLQLQLTTASLARKHHNYLLSESLILQQAGHLLHVHMENGQVPVQESLLSALSNLKAANGGISQRNILKIERETAKLLHSTGQYRDAIEIISSSSVGYICSESREDTKDRLYRAQCSELSSRSLLTLVKWLQVDHKNFSSLAAQLKFTGQGDSGGGSVVKNNLRQLLEKEKAGRKQNLGLTLDNENEKELNVGENPILTDTDGIIGCLLHLSAMESPSLSKSWFMLAGWCYKWGRKAVDNASHGSVELSLDEKAQILSIIPKGVSSEETDNILSILSQIHTPMSSEEDISDQDQYDDGAETTRRQLLSCLSLQIASDSCVDRLLSVWKGVVWRVYHYYQLSAKAYFTYLHLNGEASSDDSNEDGNVIATLRLLRLMVKHAWELRSVLECGLASTPTAPWKGIIPQLFSRLSHPEAYVRQSVSELLCRVAQDAPHLIVYPAVVGCSTTKLDMKTQNQSGFLSNYLSQTLEDGEREEPTSQENDEDDFDLADESKSKVLQNCLTSIVDSLSHQNPKMISEVTLLVHELRRITLLWDELWLGTLNQHHQDVTRRIGQLDNEIKKVTNNSNLSKEEKMAIIREKHKTVMKPTLYTMEKLQEITSQVAETPHEVWFQDTYGQLIKEAMEKLRNPSSPSHPSQSWQPFKQLHVKLQQRAQKRNSLLLKMDDISPKLDEMKATVIAMPGLGTMGQVKTIESVLKTAQILPTKTKPKKLVFRGSDGKKYPYLFKGLEDLHLDERIMQFLSIVNNMFVSANKGCQPVFRARHYSVTPLGPRSGLIQWVDGATPLFGLYKRWQQREALAQYLKNAATGGNAHTTSSNSTNIPRPSELYYSKLTPALREKGISSQESNRKEWPQSLLRKVLEELIADTPADLLARELWCSSTGPNEWWTITQTYSRSTAVMSMIGYIIGLGDRHLDNVLVDLATGEVVHIDYNVCFEKGKGLRVPEKVPFRMTQNIETALGLTGIEGTFRFACEHVIKTMRKGRETLLTLLEAFVYDPLIDWTTGNEGGYTGAFYGGGLSTANTTDGRQTKGEIEREITVSMFSIRMAEMKISWMKNRDEMIACLPRLQDQMTNWSSIATDYYTSLGSLDSLTDVQTMVSDSLGDPSHTLFTLKDRYTEYSVIKATQDEVHLLVEEKINEYSHWQKVHRHVIDTLNGQAFQKMCSDLSKPLNPGVPSFSVATEFLHGVGQSQIVTQCEQLENEITGILQVQRASLHRTMEIFHTYATIVTQFGSHFADQNRTNQYLRWLQELVCSFTSEKCEEVTAQFSDLYGNSNIPAAKKQLVLGTEVKLQNIITDVTGKLHKLLERRNLEAAETAFLECQVKDSEDNIQLFLQEHGEGGSNSLMGVVISALCSLNKRYIQMEGAAAGAGDRLMDLTSRDGDWFLDELCSMSGNVIQFLHMLKLNTEVGSIDKFPSLHQALTATHSVYISLHELNLNFRTIILPEALKTIQSQDTSVCGALETLEKILSEVGQPLDKLVAQLEMLHRNAIMGIENENMETLHVVRKMQQQFMSLVEGTESEATEMTSGQMLLMGFNGLFTQLDNEFAELLEAFDALRVPDVWRKVDAVRDAKSMQLSSFSMSTQGMLSSMFFVKRLQAMQEFFHMCTQFAATLQGLEGGSCYDDEQMSKPIKKFIAEYVRKQVIGFPSQILGYILCVLVNSLGVNVTAEIELKDVGAESKMPLEELCKKAVDTCLRNRQFQHTDFTRAGALTTSQDTAWRRHDLARRLDSNIEFVKASLQRAQLQLARLQWLHEDVFVQAGRHHNQMVMPNRATIMSEMRKSMQSLVGPETTLMACQARYSISESSILQRLRWAAGANPSLNLALQQFEEASAFRKQVCEDEIKWSQEIVNLCQGILHMEALRTRTPEAVSSDTGFITLMSKCSESCMIAASASSSVSELEVLLVSSWPPAEDQLMDSQWLQGALSDITDQVAEVKKKVISLKSDLETAKDEIRSEVQNIRSALTVHHKLMSDIRTILKSMAKQEEQEYGEQVLPGGIRQYLNLYKNFSENFTTALKMVISDDITKDGMSEASALLSDLKNQVTEIYDDLVNLAPPLLTSVDGTSDSDPMNFATALKKPIESKDMASPAIKPLLLHQKDLLMNTPPGSPQSGLLAKLATPSMKKIDKITRDPRTGKAIQERNSYAVGVWRRVKMKLDGRDPDINKRLSVAEQVDNVIKEATSTDNLAVLYEGWTPWV